MLSVVSNEEYLARRARLGFQPSRPVVIARSVVRPSLPPPQPAPAPIIQQAPKPVEVLKPFKHKNRDWLDISAILPTHSRLRTSNEIIFSTAEKYRVSVAEIKGARREKFIVKARHECCYRLSKELGYSLTQIGKILGDRDHTSVLSGIRRHEKRLADPHIDDRPTQGR